MGGACSTYGEERCIQNFDEDRKVDGRIALKWIFRKWDGNMDWIELAWDRDRWWAIVNAVMNLHVP
jgi:hypothetical protein